MSDSPAFDFWYALENTRVVRGPEQSLETFGTTRVRYHLITEVMDAANQVKVREGVLNAAPPVILTPGQYLQAPIEGFEDGQSLAFMDWLKTHKPEMRLLRYGFTVSKTDINEHVLHESAEVVEGNVLKHLEEKPDDFCAVLRGVETPWEVCLLKLMVDLVEKSMPRHVQQLRQHRLLPDPDLSKREIEDDFAAAGQDAARIPYLHKKLRQRGLFEQYQDRFFDLVRRAGG